MADIPDRSRALCQNFSPSRLSSWDPRQFARIPQWRCDSRRRPLNSITPMPPAKNNRSTLWTSIIRRRSSSRLPRQMRRLIRNCAGPPPSPRSAHARTHCKKCWCFVKEALVAAGVVKSRPQTPLAKQAGQELVNNYGFKKLPVSNPYEAPVGSVLVYGAKRAPGHVEIRTETGFVSDFRSKTPSPRPLIGVFAKS